MTAVATRMAVLSGHSAKAPSGQSYTARAACAYHLDGGGRRVRARLALHAGLSLGLESPDAITIAVTAELLHNASLIHDDLQDRDRKRHGIDAVWVRFGDGVALCAGDLLLSAAYGALASFSRSDALPGLIGLVHDAVGSAVSGQSSETAPPPKIDPRAGWYEAIAVQKSGSLLSLPIELALVGAGQTSALPLARRASEAFAVGYQIADDIEDVSSDAERQGTSSSSNFILALRAAGLADEAMAEARRVAAKYLLTAATLAEGLPDGCGDLLKDLALQCTATL